MIRKILRSVLCSLAVLPLLADTAFADDGKFTFTVLNIPVTQCGAGLAIVMQTPGGKMWLYDTGSGYPSEQGWTGSTPGVI